MRWVKAQTTLDVARPPPLATHPHRVAHDQRRRDHIAQHRGDTRIIRYRRNRILSPPRTTPDDRRRREPVAEKPALRVPLDEMYPPSMILEHPRASTTAWSPPCSTPTRHPPWNWPNCTASGGSCRPRWMSSNPTSAAPRSLQGRCAAAEEQYMEGAMAGDMEARQRLIELLRLRNRLREAAQLQSNGVEPLEV